MSEEALPQELDEKYVILIEQAMREFSAWEHFPRYLGEPVWMMRLRNTKIGRRIIISSLDGKTLTIVPSAFIVRLGLEFTEHLNDVRRTVDLKDANLLDTLRQTISWACRVDIGLEQKR